MTTNSTTQHQQNLNLTAYTSFGAWLISVLLVSYALIVQEQFFNSTQIPIASIDVNESGVLFRSEGIVRWSHVVDKQKLFDGDWVATGPQSTALLKLASGQIVNIADDSQIQIRSILRENQQYSYLITLIKGGVFADLSKNCESCPSITIKSDNRSFNIAKGETAVFTKEIGKSLKRDSKSTAISFNRPKTKVPVSISGTLEGNFQKAIAVAPISIATEPPKSTQPPIASNPIVEPPSTPIAKPAVSLPKMKFDSLNMALKDLRSFQAKIVTTENARISYTTDYKINAIMGQKLKIPVTLPVIPGLEKRLVPALRMNYGPSKKPEEIFGNPGENWVLIPVATVLSKSTPFQDGLIKDFRAKILAAFFIEGTTPNAQDYKGQEVELIVRYLGEWNRPMTLLSFDKIGISQNFSSLWFPWKNLIANQTPPFQVMVYDSTNTAALRGLVRGSPNISMNIGQKSNSGHFIIRDKQIIGEIRGSGITKEHTKLMLRLLRAETVFKGNRSAMFQLGPNMQFYDSIAKLLDEGKTLHVLKKGRTYAVSRDFIKTHAEVAAFIDAQAKAVFLEKVEIIDFM